MLVQPPFLAAFSHSAIHVFLFAFSFKVFFSTQKAITEQQQRRISKCIQFGIDIYTELKSKNTTFL